MPMSKLQLKNINKIYPNGFQAVYDLNLEIEDGEFIVFVGPSGCGKSTTLRMISGLEEISSGDMILSGRKVNSLSPSDRNIAMVFQNYALYTHMSVYENIGFGLTVKKTDKYRKHEMVMKASEITDLKKELNKTPGELSGGQRQRVALGRAIVRDTELFLMDEPLSNLDAKLRASTRREILDLKNTLNATTIYVTHDQIEAMTMADRIVIMDKGYVQQIATPQEMYDYPENVFVAKFIGSPAMNIVSADVVDNKISLLDRELELPQRLEKLLQEYHNDKVYVGIRPETIYYCEGENCSHGDIRVRIKVVELEHLGDVIVVGFKLGEQKVFARFAASSTLSIHINDELDVAFQLDKIQLFDYETEKRMRDEENEI